MKVDHILILAAGKGTRMGEIGKKLPKVIWPVFEKTILELEVAYARELYPEANLYINLYHNKEKTLEYILSHEDRFKNVCILEENEELDVGGAIHNLAREVEYKGNLLILNSDQFLICDKQIIESAVSKLNEYDSAMFLYDVKKSDGYNEVIHESGEFKGIRLNPDTKEEDFQTYTGMSVIKLDTLKAVEGKSRFFNSVIIKDETKTFCKNMKNLVYWDFGTLSRYKDSMFKLLQSFDQDDIFVKFLMRNKAIDQTKIKSKNGYDRSSGIFLEKNDLTVLENEIQYNEITDKVSS